MSFEIIEHGGAGITGGEISCVEARIPREQKPGFWNSIKYFFSPTKSVAAVWSCGEWCEPGWEEALKACRERVRNL